MQKIIKKYRREKEERKKEDQNAEDNKKVLLSFKKSNTSHLIRPLTLPVPVKH